MLKQENANLWDPWDLLVNNDWPAKYTKNKDFQKETISGTLFRIFHN